MSEEEEKKEKMEEEEKEKYSHMTVEEILESHKDVDEEKMKKNPKAWKFFNEVLKQPKYFLAPMVDCSVLPFRLLCKRHGTHVGVSPMIHATIYIKDETFRKKAFESNEEDWPSIAQLAGRDPDAMVEAAKLLEKSGACCAVDVNLGCPQRVAKKGAYGAYLADNPKLVEEIVGRLCRECHIPITCKMRVTESVEGTIAFAQMLERCGCAMITIHGRTKGQISVKNSPVNWSTIARVVESVNVPVVANGGIKNLDDVKKCLIETKAQAVMSGTGLMSNPALFEGKTYDPCDLALEFVNICQQYPVSAVIARGILVKMILSLAQKYDDLREELVTSVNLEELGPLITELKKRRDSGDTGSHGLEQIPPPWTCDRKYVELALSKVTPEYELWRPAICYPRGPLNRKPHGPTGGWISIVGIGNRSMSQESLLSLKAVTQARAWACRHAVVCLDIPDDEIYQTVMKTHRVNIYYRVKTEELPKTTTDDDDKVTEPPTKIQHSENQQ